MKKYREIFDKVEETLISVGTQNLSENEIRASLNEFKNFEGKRFSDAEYFWKVVCVVFYSGFKAATVTAKLPAIEKHFSDYRRVMTYDVDQIEFIMNDPQMIRNRRKIQSCIDNAKVVQKIVDEFGSFQRYIDTFETQESFENILLLKEELEYQFSGFGRITTYHFLTDIGLPVLKPDRVLSRIFKRLGLIENEGQLLKTVIQGRKFADATGHPIRYIDIVFVAYGQVESREFGINRGICLEKKPTCSICGVKKYCKYSTQM